MNNKGIFLAVSIVLFLLSLIYFSSSINSSINSFSLVYSDISRISAVNSKFESIYSNIVLLDSDSYLKETKERILPFSYSLDENIFSLNSEIPLTETSQNLYFDYINTFRILISDSNRLNAFDGIQTDFNSSQNSFWGGDSNEMNFLLVSHCAKNSFQDLNTFIFSFIECNSKEPDFNSIKQINLDLNISPLYVEDFNSVYCNLNGIESCVQNDFNAFNSLPFLRISFNSAECNNCILPEETIISTHYNSAEANYIIFSCSGASCSSEPLRIDLQNQIKISRAGENRIQYNIAFDFNSAASQLELNDVLFKVSSGEQINERSFSGWN
ncbi:MAG: hypothetical protein JW703_04070 [Candidatus Diapherotrites archaeon]|nr:hypothetical protein [Candidatus Diapherotrites archaeon]